MYAKDEGYNSIWSTISISLQLLKTAKSKFFCIVKILVVYSCNTKYLFGNNIITLNTHFQSS